MGQSYLDIQRGWVKDCALGECRLPETAHEAVGDAEDLYAHDDSWSAVVSKGCMKVCVKLAHMTFECSAKGIEYLASSGHQPTYGGRNCVDLTNIEPGEIVAEDDETEGGLPWLPIVATTAAVACGILVWKLWNRTASQRG